MKGVLYAASEGLPYIKSGGLADVIGSLPLSLDSKAFKVAVVLPMYGKIIEKHPELEKVCEYPVKSGLIDCDCEIYHSLIENVEYYFVRQDKYFNRESMYGYADDGERFAFFSKAVLDLVDKLEFKIDLIHCHDWHTGMIPLLGKKLYSGKKYKKIKYIYTIHNLAFQGNFSKETLKYFDLKDDVYFDGTIKFDEGISYMKAGILCSDKVTTVSDSYVKEILTPEYGERFDKTLAMRKDDLVGIVNGIDINNWNPAKDENIAQNYTIKSLKKKNINKKAIQKELGLRVADDVLLIGIVSRLTNQKGVSLILEKLSQVMNQDLQFIILGTGDNYIENQFKKIEYDYPHRAVFYCGYNEALSHKVYAGIDMLIMPSLFEPCGISQLIAMRYGTLPLVREVGGLKDTVVPYNEYDKTGTGFTFKLFNSDDFLHVLKYAINTYYFKREDFNTMQINAMKTDVSWALSAKKYKELYKKCLSK